MKTKMIAVALFAFTVTAILALPMQQSNGGPVQATPVANTPGVDNQSRIEVVFVLDTTGSMSGLIEAAKEKIWSIASSMAQADPAPVIRMGLVAYRDRGDDYVTRVVGLTDDLDSVYGTLMDFNADGGGDGPESVNKALYDAVHQIAWSKEQNTYRVLFLVGDAPPHMDYQDEMQYPEIVALAKQRGILINTIQAGESHNTRRQWQHIASLGGGEYFQVEQDGSAVAIATPYDERLAKLSHKLDETRLYYGDDEMRAEKERKLAATRKLHESATVSSRARRATFNSTASGERNLLGGNELVEDVTSGKVDLDKIDQKALPAPMQAMSPEEQKQLVAETAERRQKLKKEIHRLSQQRKDYLTSKVEEEGSAKESLDDRIYSAVKAQAAAKGMKYESESPAY